MRVLFVHLLLVVVLIYFCVVLGLIKVLNGTENLPLKFVPSFYSTEMVIIEDLSFTGSCAPESFTFGCMQHNSISDSDAIF